MPEELTTTEPAPPIWIRKKNGIAFSDVSEQPGGRMPDFCIIGAAKAGTSALNAILNSHPSVFMCSLKEPHYFSTDVMLERGDQWYMGLFSQAAAGQICGEASTSYSRHPMVAGTAERMARANPSMKIVYILREPVERCQSDCLQILKYAKHVLEQDYTKMTFDDFFEMIEQPNHPFYSAIVESSCYIDQIEAFEQVFPTSQILLLTHEEFRSDPQGFLAKICAFIGVDAAALPQGNETKNVTNDFINGLDQEQAVEKLRNVPFFNLAKAILSDSAKRKIRTLIAGRDYSDRLRFSPALAARLAHRFKEPNGRLATRLGSLPDVWENMV